MLRVLGVEQEHIAEVRWRSPSDGKTVSQGETMFSSSSTSNGAVNVTDGINTVSVGVSREKWLRTHADGKWTDNPLVLPRY
jgi:hypothetical protein